MKKLVVALSALAAFTGSAVAADMAPRPYTKAPAPVAAVANWTGCYVGGGGGYGMWNQENRTFDDTFVPRRQISDTATTGGRGYFGTVQGGCDYQFALGSWNMVVGAFGDYDFADIHGRHVEPATNGVANEKMSSAWAVGARAGVLVTPSLLTYFVGGYTEATFDRQNYTNYLGPNFGVLNGLYTDKQTYKGYFLGAGDEYALSFLPGLYWKTEYRVSQFDTKNNPVLVTVNGARTGFSEDSRKWVQTIRSELVYHFNWGGAVVAKY